MRLVVGRTPARCALAVCAALGTGCTMASGDAEGMGAGSGADDARVPEGFAIDVLATGLESVRTLKFGPDGMMYVALPEVGRIVRIDVAAPDRAPAVIAEGLNRPYGLAFFDGGLYVGEHDKVVRLDGPDFVNKTVIVPGLPTGGHWTREIVFGGDGMLYVSVGSSCNLCEEQDERRAAVTRYAPDGTGATVVARGLRNAAGLAVHPTTGAIWASQNERDNLGDDVPPEEINILSDGTDFGWPYCYGARIPNPEYHDQARCATTTPPALEIQAHSAPLGMTFYTGEQFPEEWRGDLFVAFHGSWNRARKTGYMLAHVDVRDGRPVSYRPFAEGWLEGERASGRPVYPVVGPDGSLYLSDDEGGRIYRIRWVGQ
jgi:glucose/arabinose dehydrogenase